MSGNRKYSEITRNLWLNAAVITKSLDNSLGAIHGIGLTEYMVLLSLAEAPNHALRRIDIANAIARTGSGVTRLLMPMEKIGLVTKEVNTRDARVSLVKITPAGMQLFKDASVTLDQKSQALLMNLAQDKADRLLELLEAI